jgi:hypothetical protein
MASEHPFAGTMCSESTGIHLIAASTWSEVVDDRGALPASRVGSEQLHVVVTADLTTRRSAWTSVPPELGGGFRLTRLHPDGLWTALGFRTGDVVVAVDGHTVPVSPVPPTLAEAASRLDDRALAVEWRRGGAREVVCLVAW